jgi:excisionase family DNA binding protein
VFSGHLLQPVAEERNMAIAQKERPALVNLAEVAAILGVHRNTAHRLVAAGTLRPVRIAGLGHPRYRRADVERLIAGEEKAP